MSTTATQPTQTLAPWSPKEITTLLPVAPGLVEKYMHLFVNRLSFCEQAQWGDHRYFRPRHRELQSIAKRLAEKAGCRRDSQEFQDRVSEIYFSLVKERNLASDYEWITPQVIEKHLAGQITINLYAINPANQCCKWVAIDADYEQKRAEEDLSALRQELLKENIHAVQEYSRRGGHLWIFCEEPLLARKCRIFIYNLALQLGVPIKASGFDAEGIEIFPKQDLLEPGALGNAIRAPLGIHRKNNTRYWFRGIGNLTLKDQIEAIWALPKMTAEQLDMLTLNMPVPPQWVEPPEEPPVKRKVYSNDGKQKRPPFNIYDHTRDAHRRQRATLHDHFRRCPSCERTGQDTTGDNLEVGNEDGPKHGLYKCQAGCSTDDIRVACGYPPRDPRYRKR